MFKHIVMWKLDDSAESGNRVDNSQKMKKILEDLKDKIPQIKHIEVGIDVCCTGSSYDVVLYTEFENQVDCETYMKHPDHINVAGFIGKVSKERVLVDYEV